MSLAPNSLEIVRKVCRNVTKVKDSARSIGLTITPGDVKDAKPLDHRNCAVARACKREFGCDEVIVGIGVIAFAVQAFLQD